MTAQIHPAAQKSSAGAAIIRIVVADDHSVIREGIAAMLSRDTNLTIVAEARSGAEAITQYRQHRPDVILLDVVMPGIDGLAAAIAIRREFSDARIVLLTLSEREEDIYQGILAGAMAYLPKTIECAELIQAIHDVYSGQSVLPNRVATSLMRRVSGCALTSREKEILHWIAQGESNAEIGERLFIAEGTARTHVSHILAKLGARDRTQAVTNAIQRGILRM